MGISVRERKLRKELVEAGRWLHRQGFVAATAGNLSVRLDHRRVLTTPTGCSKARLAPQDLVVVDMQGNRLAGRRKASSETDMHLTIYRQRPDVNGVVHAHPPTATGFAAAGVALQDPILAEVVVVLGDVPLARYATPGSPELSRALEPLVAHRNAVLMANHGVVTLGKDLWEALFHMETVEHYARITLVTKLLGSQVLLSKANLKKLKNLRPAMS